MPETRRSSWVWTPRNTVLVAAASVAMVVWVVAGAWMLFSPRSDRPPVAAASAALRASSPVSPSSTPKPKALAYAPKRYTGPLPSQPAARPPVAKAHPAQATASDSPSPSPSPQSPVAPSSDGPTDGTHHHEHGPRHPGHHHGH